MSFRIFGRLDRAIEGVEFARRIFAEHHAGMRHFLGLRFIVGDHHGHAKLAVAEQVFGEFFGKRMNRGARCRRDGGLSGVQRNSRPGQPIM